MQFNTHMTRMIWFPVEIYLHFIRAMEGLDKVNQGNMKGS